MLKAFLGSLFLVILCDFRGGFSIRRVNVMMKYINIRYLLVFILFSVNGMAMDEKDKEPTTEGKKPIRMSVNPGGEINGKSPYFTFRSIREEDVSAVQGIINKCEFKEGLPGSPRRITALIHTLVDRQEETPYSGLVIQEGESLVAALGLGYMNVLEPDKLKAEGIVDAYVKLGIMDFIDPDGENKYAHDNIKRVDIDIQDFFPIWQQASLTSTKMGELINTQKGLGTILPLIPESLGHEKIREVLKIGVNVFQVLRNAGHLLPVEETLPTHVIGLFHPKDPLIVPLKDVGFNILESEDFKIYYNAEPRVMAYYKLQ